MRAMWRDRRVERADSAFAGADRRGTWKCTVSVYQRRVAEVAAGLVKTGNLDYTVLAQALRARRFVGERSRTAKTLAVYEDVTIEAARIRSESGALT